MRIIKNMKDIELLKEVSTVKSDILQIIEGYFKTIYNNYEHETITLQEFTLNDIGVIVLLEAGDNVADLQEIGLNPKVGGLLGAFPEWLSVIKHENCTLIEACILYNNEYALSLFFEREQFGQDVENWIEENL